jgi:hypothetical protein
MLQGSLIHLGQRGHYLHVGILYLSLANAVVIILMVLVFVAALLIPFPKDRLPKDGAK